MNKIKLFAHLRESAGKEEIELDAAGKTINELKAILTEAYHLNLETVMTAVNEEFALDHELIKEGDVIAFIPPVSGG
ncbi:MULTISPECIES: molybdopterin converting factor subunit 1 [Bacillus]|uniref:Molybdopterin synthase sulfur carrier subunit n=2 Tax=Bacillus infantis TaxID=324767 RepID=U5LIY0_9BACI|nr:MULTISPECIES: molybdopterin converting factor subunit 1 [Bacillus]OXT15675.1 molybdopterin synthase sulfur carrier subunit [Bacillus sp. OG2]AGX06656.1 molybdenum cofactor biosynthesis protein MoaD [Bacillus infantis NRRL B-14911]EAR63664.1 molybdopterin converting factor, subunit 1 [Bacillus sp. NRRL B-14911]MCA1033327.1 molybdopterin converting factor subunit 1 [Bacillus infantis]MCK6206760.1 molybdopterin converting factor subunit 1 [Bacillus infantis]